MPFESQEKKIEIPGFWISGNLIKWENTMIQMANISYIATGNLILKPFPVLAIVCIVIGFFIFNINVAIAAVLLIAGAIWIGAWYQDNEERKKRIVLSIVMNSGTSLKIVFDDREFLMKVQKVMEKILMKGGSGSQNIAINIQDCTITNSDILDDMRIY